MSGDRTIDVLVRHARMRAAARRPLSAHLSGCLLGLAAADVARHELAQRAIDAGRVDELFHRTPPGTPTPSTGAGAPFPDCNSETTHV